MNFCDYMEKTTPVFDDIYPLRSKALLLHEPGADGGDDGGAVAAGVGGRQGKQDGGEKEDLQRIPVTRVSDGMGGRLNLEYQIQPGV